MGLIASFKESLTLGVVMAANPSSNTTVCIDILTYQEKDGTFLFPPSWWSISGSCPKPGVTAFRITRFIEAKRSFESKRTE